MFAYEHELIAWSGTMEPADLLPADDERERGAPAIEPSQPVPPATAALPATAAARRGGHWAWKAAAGLAVACAVVLAIPATRTMIWPPANPAAPAAALPQDAKTAALFVAARDLWARRTPQDLKQAIGLYEKVIAADPDFAPAYAGLAEAWLIYREYGAAGESEAYSAAKSSVEQALTLDPDLPAAHRANGFIQYWWSYDAQRSVDSFQRALELDPRDGLTHFWYANVLSDLGQDVAAQREYDTAQLLLPGTPTIAVERACAHWQAGRDAQAIRELERLVQRYPDDATIHNCLAWALISRGDIAGYAREYTALATLRKVPTMLKAVRRAE